MSGSLLLAAAIATSLGEVRVDCADPGPWTFALESSGATDGVETVRVTMRAERESAPPKFAVAWFVPQTDVHHVWSSGSTHYGLPWNDPMCSELSSSMPVYSLLDADDNSRFAFACSESCRRVLFRCPVSETKMGFSCSFEFFTVPEAPIREYAVEIRLDSRRVFYGDAIGDAVAWIVRAAGIEPLRSPEAAFEPLYSTWYDFHQDISAAGVEKECARAAELGMRTVIVDDGWQIDLPLGNRPWNGYRLCGDWEPGRHFPDMAAHVKRVQDMGFKYMMWYSVPFVGKDSRNFSRFKGKFLPAECAGGHVLDPRFPEVRAFIAGIYEDAVRKWNIDGLKLDFIGRFTLGQGQTDPAVAEGCAGRDIKSIPLAVEALLSETIRRLRALKPDILIEFRQPYVGPSIRRFGNMLRASDCPLSMVENRTRIARLRLTSGGTAVHSDMLEWRCDETAESAARHILNSIFGVVQYSLHLDSIPDRHREMMAHWIRFSTTHREALVKGRFRPHHPAADYPLLEGESAAERIFGVYQRDLIVDAGEPDRTVFVLNGANATSLPIRFRRAPARIEVRDTFGELIAVPVCGAGLNSLSVPVSGYVKVLWHDPASRMPVEAFWNASLGTDNVLRMDSANEGEFEWARYAMTSGDRVFKPNTRYEITFRARVWGRGSGSYLYAIMRPLSTGGAEKDVCDLPVHSTDGAWQDCKMAFTTGREPDYRLQFHSHNRITAEVADLRIVERGTLRLATCVPSAAPVARPAGLPTGAREFDVDLPRPKRDLVLNAADFGVSPTNEDNAVALRRAFAEAKARGAAKLVLDSGDYRMRDARSLVLEGFTDFTFDGGGARFVSSRSRDAFIHLRGCVRTRLMNFSIDWDWEKAPLASVVEVKAIGKGFVDLLFREYEDFPNKKAAFLVLSPFDPVTRSVGVEGMSTKGLARFWGELTPFPGKWVAPNVARLKTSPGGLKVGELYRLQHYYYHMNGVSMDSNEHLRLEHVTILSTPGHGFLIHGTQHHTLFDRVDIVAPKDDPRRVITCAADHLHVGQSRGFIKMVNCEFSLGGDDIFNMHDCSGFARAHGPRTVRTQNARSYGNLRRGTRVELRHGDYSPTGFVGTVVEDRAVDAGGGVYDITFEEDLPAVKDEGFVLFDRTYDTRNIIVRNCFFHDNRARGLLILARDVTVENNVFRHQEMGAIKIETGYTLNVWSEGYGVSNVVIRGNSFENQNPSGSNALHRERTIYAGIYLKRDPSEDVTDYPIIRDLLFENNVFSNSCGVAAYVTSAKGVTFLNNVFEDPTPRRNELSYRSQLYFSNARDVKVLGCDYRPSKSVTPAVVYDVQSCPRMDVR